MDCVFEFKYGYIWKEPMAKKLFEMLLSLQEDSRYYTTYNNNIDTIKLSLVETDAIYNGTHNIKVSFVDFIIKIVEGHKHYITYLDRIDNEQEQYVLIDELYIIKLKKYEQSLFEVRNGYETLYEIEDIVKIRDNDLLKINLLATPIILENSKSGYNKARLKSLYDKARKEQT